MDFTKFANGDGGQEAQAKKAEAKPAEVMAPSDPMDLEGQKARFRKYHVLVKDLQARSGALVVDSDQKAVVATAMASQVAGAMKDLEFSRKKIVEKPDKFVRGVNAFFRGFSQPLDAIKKALANKLAAHAYQVEMQRRKDEKAAQDERDRLQAQMDEAAATHEIERVELPEIVVPKKQAAIRTEGGSSAARMVWTFEVEDVAQVPADYMVVDEAAIKKAVAAGIRSIPGVRIYEKTAVSIRG